MVKTIDYCNISDASEKDRFVDMFDRFSDFNVKNLGEYNKKTKPNHSSYSEPNERLTVCGDQYFISRYSKLNAIMSF